MPFPTPRATMRPFLSLCALLIAAFFTLLAVVQSAQADKTAHQGKTTPAARLRSPKKTLRFCIYGDTRDGHDIHRKILALMLKQKPDFIITTGDLVHRGKDESLWKIYDDITGEARKKTPFYPARGNHDLGGPGYEERVTEPFATGNKLYYTFDKANCHFICLAVDEGTAYDAESPQYKWLVKDLENTKKTKPEHIFVYFHVPPYSIGSHGSDLDVRKELCPVFIKYGVHVVLNGHDHNYYRTKRDGVTYLVTGGGGAALYPCYPNKGAIEGDKFESVNNCVICDVDGPKITFTALRADGTTLDHFTVSGKKE